MDYSKWDSFECEESPLASNLSDARSLRTKAAELVCGGQYRSGCDMYQKALAAARNASKAAGVKWDGIFKRDSTGSVAQECKELEFSVQPPPQSLVLLTAVVCSAS